MAVDILSIYCVSVNIGMVGARVVIGGELIWVVVMCSGIRE
jgi:hypothetical protein